MQPIQLPLHIHFYRCTNKENGQQKTKADVFVVVAYLSRGCHGDALFRNGRAVEQLLPEDDR